MYTNYLDTIEKYYQLNFFIFVIFRVMHAVKVPVFCHFSRMGQSRTSLNNQYYTPIIF